MDKITNNMRKIILILLVFAAFGMKAQNYNLREYKVWTTVDTLHSDEITLDSIVYYCIRENFVLDRKIIKFKYRKDVYVDDTLVPASQTFPKHINVAWKQDNFLRKDGVVYDQDTIFDMMRFGTWKVNRKWIGRKLVKGKLK